MASVAVLTTASSVHAAVVPAQGDAWTTDRFPTRNYGTDTTLRINSTPRKRAFLRFEVVSPGGPVRQAFLRVFAQSGAPQGFRVYATSAAWTENAITHNAAPAQGALVATVAPFTATNSWRTIDVTSAVTGAGGIAFLIAEPGAQADIVLGSKEGGQAAQLDVLVELADPPLNTALPGIAGTLRVGETLAAVAGTWAGTEPIARTYQWQRCGPAGGGCADVPGAVGGSYLLAAADFDKTIRVRETATNPAASVSATSAATARIAAAPEPPVPVTPPAVTGSPQLGQTLTAVPGTWSGTTPLALAFHWQRCSPTVCADVDGATGATYLLAAADVGSAMRVRQTATNGIGSASADSTETAVVTDPGDAPVALTLPAIEGTARLGQTLTALPGTWNGTTPMAFSYQWVRCGIVGGGCVEVPGATGSAYLLGDEDVDRTIRVRQTAANPAGSTAAASDPTAVVLGIPVPPPPPPPSGDCSRDDATGCTATAGSRVSLLNQKFTCNRPLGDIAAQNPIGTAPGRLPLLVEIDFTTYVDLNPAVVDLRQDCVGDGDDETIDLILAVEGDGRTIGGTVDAIKVRLTASDIQLTGHANCGPRGLGSDGVPNTPDDSHQDGAQIQGGNKIEFVDFEWGDWETGTATCQGAAGTFVPASVNANPVQDMACIRCKSVSCNHGMYLGVSDGTLIVDSKWRTGNPTDRTGPLANGPLGLCMFGSPPCASPPARRRTS